MRIGVDVDGVLADFNVAFIKRIIRVTGQDLFPDRPFEIPMWDYPQHYGYTNAQIAAVWEDVKRDTCFWANLLPYTTTRRFFQDLDVMAPGSDVYFITNRTGHLCRRQTENWLIAQGAGPRPLIVISGDKAGWCQALNLDIYIDDNFENAVAVGKTHTRSFLLNRPWNACFLLNQWFDRIDDPSEMLRCSLLDR